MENNMDEMKDIMVAIKTEIRPVNALQAGNPEYNESLQTGRRVREQLSALGLRVEVIAAIPTVSAPLNADMITEEELVRTKVDATLPINLHFQFQGKEDWHNVGLLRKMMRPGTPGAFRSLFANIYGNTDPAGRTASDVMLGIPEVNAALQKHLSLV